jgi:putative membrane protein
LKGGNNVLDLATQVLAEGGNWGPGGWWPIFPILWFLFFGFLIFALFRWRRGGPPQWAGRQSAEGVLAERYARGEISEDEYRERLTVLKSNP